MNKSLRFFLVIFFSGINVLSALCQPVAAERPRLVVGIMVDGLQQKHIDQLWNYLDSNGFKRIIEKGTNCTNVSYTTVSAGNTSDIATVMTGTIPKYNGVVGDRFFNRSINEVESIILDENQIGIGTKQTVSAHNLLSSTVVDELMMANPGKSRSYAIAFNAEEAIMLGGHTARSVMWMDDAAQKWVASGYYTDGLSRWADEMNVNGGFRSRATALWTPMYSINTYLNPAAREDKKSGFQYDPSTRKAKNLPATILRNTPSANSLVAELAMKIFTEEQLGTDKYPDMLLLQFTVRTPGEKNNALQSAEKEDIYMRLDKDIQALLQKIDTKIGLDRTLVFMFGNQTSVHSPAELGENKIPAGYFNANRSMALLSTYLMAIYGQERWIDGYYGKNIFLNKKKIEEKKINFRDMQQTVAEFMLEFEGIQTAFTSGQVLSGGQSSNMDLARVQNSVHKRCTGDIIFTLLPGWLEVDDKNNLLGESNTIVTNTPVYFYGWKVPTQQVGKAYQTTDIAPTISRILDIPTPNASIGKPIEELTK